MSHTCVKVTAFCVTIILSGCGVAPDTAIAPIAAETNSFPAMKGILPKLSQQFPELVEEVSTYGKTLPSPIITAWEGEEYAAVGLRFKDKPRYRSSKNFYSKFPKSDPEPLLDLTVELVRYPSASAAQHALLKNLDLRPAMKPPVQNYRGAALYAFTVAFKPIICRFEQYIIEIRPERLDIGSLDFQILDFILSELGAPSRKPKQPNHN